MAHKHRNKTSWNELGKEALSKKYRKEKYLEPGTFSWGMKTQQNPLEFGKDFYNRMKNKPRWMRIAINILWLVIIGTLIGIGIWSMM